MVPLNMFNPSCDFFAYRTKAKLLLWIIFVAGVSCLSLLCCLVCFLRPCGRLLGDRDWALSSLVYCVFCLVHWYPGSAVVLDCIDS